MTMNILITSSAATVIVEGHPYTISREHERFEALLNAYESGNVDEVKAVIDSLNKVKTWAKDKVGDEDIVVAGGQVYYKGQPLENAVTKRILEWVELSLDPQPMVNFLRRLLNNPSYQSREELLLFLEHGKLPIQEDGRFLAYKVVRSDYRDKHSGKFDNSVGKVVSMPRGDVDDNRQNTCSSGLHFCSKDYIPHFTWGEDRLVLLAIDPADVVSIPYDYNNAKGRACRYEVIEEVKQAVEFDSPLYSSDLSQRAKQQPRDEKGRFVKA